jgi:hypothetical protein
MTIDPVVLLAEDLSASEAALSKATRIYQKGGLREDGELVNLLLARIKRLLRDLFETVPTSAIGAAELVGMAAKRLPFSYSHYATHLHEIADRLSLGRRTHSDLVWLRALQAALADGVCGKDGDKIMPLLDLAIIGASRPVTVFRAVTPARGPAPWQGTLVNRSN